MNRLVWLVLACLVVKCGLIGARSLRATRAHAAFKRWVERHIVADVPDGMDL